MLKLLKRRTSDGLAEFEIAEGTFGHWTFEFDSNFGFRISSFLSRGFQLAQLGRAHLGHLLVAGFLEPIDAPLQHLDGVRTRVVAAALRN
jgi:hypothetical protein